MKQINRPDFNFLCLGELIRSESEGVRDPSDDRVRDFSPTRLVAIAG